MQTRYLDAVRAFEGFAERSTWDYAQQTNGFGTKALYPGEKISVEEANRRFLAEIEEARRFVESQAQGWDEGTKAALTSLTFNAGTRWASSGLGEAVRSFDIDSVRSRFLEYTKAGGEALPGLVRRRLAEVTWIGEGVAQVPEAVARASSSPPPAAMPMTTQAANSQPKSAATLDDASPVTDLLAALGSNRFDRANTIEATAAERHSSIAWMLLALDIATLNSQLTQDRDNDAPVAV